MKKLELEQVNNFSKITLRGSSKAGVSPTFAAPHLLTSPLRHPRTLQKWLQQFLHPRVSLCNLNLLLFLSRRDLESGLGLMSCFDQQTELCNLWAWSRRGLSASTLTLLELWDEKPRLAFLRMRGHVEREAQLTTKTNHQACEEGHVGYDSIKLTFDTWLNREPTSQAQTPNIQNCKPINNYCFQLLSLQWSLTQQ